MLDSKKDGLRVDISEDRHKNGIRVSARTANITPRGFESPCVFVDVTEEYDFGEEAHYYRIGVSCRLGMRDETTSEEDAARSFSMALELANEIKAEWAAEFGAREANPK